MTRKNPDYALTAEQFAAEQSESPLAYMVLTKVVREHVPVVQSPHGGTLGQAVDRVLAKALKDGEEVQSFTVEISPERWQEMARAHHGIHQ